jgi:VIT1/CCC1 family predicted Fe2+/Mn2+ transporter
MILTALSITATALMGLMVYALITGQWGYLLAYAMLFVATFGVLSAYLQDRKRERNNYDDIDWDI